MTSTQRTKAFKDWKYDLEERLAFYLFQNFDADHPATSYAETEKAWIIRHQLPEN